MVLAIVALASAGMLALNAPRALGSGTVLDVADGAVFVSHAGVEADARDAQPLGEGDEVRTGPEGHAVILFFDGSTVSLEPATTIRLDVARTAGPSTLVELSQTVGGTWHAVHKLLDAGSRYQVTTPGLSAVVRGTAFAVRVGDREDEVTTEEGIVEVAAQQQSVQVAPGQRTSVRRGDPPAPPQTAPRPQRTLRLELGGGTGVVVDGARRTVGVAPDGSLRNTIPGARVERDGGIVRIVLPDPHHDLRFAPGSGAGALRYEVVGAAGEVLSNGLASPAPGPISRVLQGVDSAILAAPSLPTASTPPAPTLARPSLAAPTLAAAGTRSPTLATPTIAPPPSAPTALPTIAIATPSPTLAPTTATLPPIAAPSLPPIPSLATPSPTPSATPTVTAPTPTFAVATPTPIPTTGASPWPTLVAPTPSPSVAPSPTLFPLPSPTPVLTPIPTTSVLPSPTFSAPPLVP